MSGQSRIKFLEAFRNNQVIIVVGDVTSEKTTQVPKWCLDEIRKLSCSEPQSVWRSLVVCTQPKRVAVVSLASRIAKEMGVELGEEVGFAIRFENRSGPKTSLKYVTDGLLLREAGADPTFKSYGCVVLDEVQERTAATDTLVSLLKQILSERIDLKLVVMTKDPDSERFAHYFDNAPIVHLAGGSDPRNTFDAPQEEQRTKIPEVLKSDLMPLVLQLKKLGVADPLSIGYLDSPTPEAVNKAREALKILGALDDFGNLTETGEIMADLPLHPQLARALIASCDLHCSDEVRSIIALLSLPGPVPVPRKVMGEAAEAQIELIHPDGDHLTMLNIYRAIKQSQNPSGSANESLNQELLSRAVQIDLQLASMMGLFNLGPNSTSPAPEDYSLNVRRALASGYFMQVAYRGEDARYRTINDNQVVKLHPTTHLKSEPSWVIYSDLMETPERYIRVVTAIEPEWLLELMPPSFRGSSLVHNEVRNRLEEVAARLNA